jgi:hypothetical protein
VGGLAEPAYSARRLSRGKRRKKSRKLVKMGENWPQKGENGVFFGFWGVLGDFLGKRGGFWFFGRFFGAIGEGTP